MLISVAKIRLSFLLAAGGASCAACSGDSNALFSDVPGENGAASATAGSTGKDPTAQGGSVANGGSESAGGSIASGGTNPQAGSGATGGGDESRAGTGSGGNAGQDSGGGGGTTDNGGSVATAGTAGSAGATGGAGTAGGGGATGGAGASGSGGATAGASTAGSAGSGGTGGTNNGAPCPDVFGAYMIQSAEGNCNGLNTNATQSITGSAPQCLAHFVSASQAGGRGVNGAGALDAAGDFKGAVLSFNNTQRTNCSGTWDAVNELMTVKCGALGELCTVVLQRD